MAEAGDSAPTRTGRFFCHNCSEDLSDVLEDFTCPKCKYGFVEILSDAPSNASEVQRANLGSGSGPDMNFSFAMGERAGTQPVGAGGVPANSQANRRYNAQQPVNPVEEMVLSFLNDLSIGLNGGGVTGRGIPMFASLDDFVSGNNVLGAIVTELMSQVQVDGSGRPPMPTDKLDNLPTIKISQEQVDRKLQCSVCLEDFNLHEQVKQLECDHIFHPDCIVPWLKLHGTCPICRKDLTTQGDGSGAPSARFEPPEPRIDGNLGQHGQSSSGASNRGNDLDRMDHDLDFD